MSPQYIWLPKGVFSIRYNLIGQRW